ncbi:hypothetical protein [Mesorhizobium sp.]|uniref:hypothetical protein n=1 Tax=Mesorhizobium sp. TaxID=1871066 RepID=UPI000FE9392E|nr:hypothetical protein [Mesorhizobium sp.]RWP61126.1 MAG: hypothetical protein EOR08_18650 [Mesorhizobium sp.]
MREFHAHTAGRLGRTRHPRRRDQLSPAGDPELRSKTATGHDRAHPTNVALKGDKVCTADLRRWHITELDLPDA